MKILVGILAFILLSILLKSCIDQEYSHSWGCTKYVTIKYADGRRDTSYRVLYVRSSDDSYAEVTKVDTLPDGTKRTTIERATCVHIQTSP